MIANPLGLIRARARSTLDNVLSAEMIPFVQYEEPAGDAGYFGPDSAIWYVHGHLSVLLGLGAGGWVQALDPFMTAGLDTSDYTSDPVKTIERERRFFSFIFGTTFGSKDVANRIGKMIDARHRKITGDTPDGRPFSASDPETLRFAHAAFGLGFANAHIKYHPKPLDAAGMDRYMADYAVVGELMGVPNPPTTMAEAMQVLEQRAPGMSVHEYSIRTREVASGLPYAQGFFASRLIGLAEWGSFDLIPPFAKRLWQIPEQPIRDAIRAILVRALINAPHTLAGAPGCIVTATKRAHAKPLFSELSGVRQLQTG